MEEILKLLDWLQMKKNQILNESEVAEGLTLACQAYPTTTTIKIDFDDV